MNYIQEFAQLAENVRAETMASKSHAGLGGIATRHLESFMASSDFDPSDFLSWSISSSELPRQGWDFDFGEPAITVARNDLIRIDLLFWMQKAAPIHDHVTCGSFGALFGDRIHSRYTFDRDTAEVDQDVEVGVLTKTNLHLMREAEASEIQPHLIHDIYWLDTPSVTIVIRCNDHPDVDRRPADYLAPGLRIVDSMRLSDSMVKRRTEALELLALADPESFEVALRQTFTHGVPSQVTQAFASAAVQHPELLNTVLESIEDKSLVLTTLERSREWLVHRSAFGGVYATEDPAVQLLAALLWAGAHHEEIVQTFKEVLETEDAAEMILAARTNLIEMDAEMEEILEVSMRNAGLGELLDNA